MTVQVVVLYIGCALGEISSCELGHTLTHALGDIRDDILGFKGEAIKYLYHPEEILKEHLFIP